MPIAGAAAGAIAGRLLTCFLSRASRDFRFCPMTAAVCTAAPRTQDYARPSACQRPTPLHRH
eukprot:362355-Chlamydomonas_euryale.AAC.12